MEQETNKLLRKNFELTKKNNKLLKKLHRAAVIGNIFRLVWFAIVVGIPVAIYYYVILPYYIEVTQAYQNVQNGIGDFKDVFNKIPLIGEFLHDFLTSSAIDSVK